MAGLPLTPREIAKRALYAAYTRFQAPAKAKEMAAQGVQRVSILCYHRVDDRLKDNVTLGLEQFDQQIALLKRHYQVVRADAIVRGEIDRSSARPIVAVTFDDGYLDNYANAHPILKKHGVPATFFVSTGIVDTDREFQHDIDKNVRGLPNMSWDQIRELHAEGHEIGAHTINHVNIAKVDQATAETELTDALARVRQEIGVQDVAYAYCFGKRSDITAERRELARRLGYSACYAAYGGTNEGEIDLFDIKRFGVNYGFSETAFRAKIEGCPYGGGAEASG
jgi:peptidoglycan/xylan/chitin deacetylase (PgdA/CDA1 family)